VGAAPIQQAITAETDEASNLVQFC